LESLFEKTRAGFTKDVAIVFVYWTNSNFVNNFEILFEFSLDKLSYKQYPLRPQENPLAIMWKYHGNEIDSYPMV
jgi:hypothetical protein